MFGGAYILRVETFQIIHHDTAAPIVESSLQKSRQRHRYVRWFTVVYQAVVMSVHSRLYRTTVVRRGPMRQQLSGIGARWFLVQKYPASLVVVVVVGSSTTLALAKIPGESPYQLMLRIKQQASFSNFFANDISTLSYFYLIPNDTNLSIESYFFLR